MSRQERSEIRAKMTSIKETPLARRVLNCTAVFLMITVTFLFGFFA